MCTNDDVFHYSLFGFTNNFMFQDEMSSSRRTYYVQVGHKQGCLLTVKCHYEPSLAG